MSTSAIFSFLHFAAVFGIVGTIFFEWLTLSESPSHAEATKLQRCDRWYGMCAVGVLVLGALRVVYFEKGSAFYLANPFFHLKIGLFILLGLLSIYPTVRFVKWQAETRQGLAPVVSASQYRTMRTILRLEVVLYSRSRSARPSWRAGSGCKWGGASGRNRTDTPCGTGF